MEIFIFFWLTISKLAPFWSLVFAEIYTAVVITKQTNRAERLLSICVGMAFSILFWSNYTAGTTKLNKKSETAVQSDQVLKFIYEKDASFVRNSVPCPSKSDSDHVVLCPSKIQLSLYRNFRCQLEKNLCNVQVILSNKIVPLHSMQFKSSFLICEVDVCWLLMFFLPR